MGHYNNMGGHNNEIDPISGFKTITYRPMLVQVKNNNIYMVGVHYDKQ